MRNSDKTFSPEAGGGEVNWENWARRMWINIKYV
jgi:hypothetical protein